MEDSNLIGNRKGNQNILTKIKHFKETSPHLYNGILVGSLALLSVTIFLVILFAFVLDTEETQPTKPIMIGTWDFSLQAIDHGFDLLEGGNSGLDAIEKAGNWAEDNPEACGYSVGYGGSPNTLGETALDAQIMDGQTHAMGAVGSLKRVKHAISVARKVMEETYHTLLVGEDATRFAQIVGFTTENLQTNRSKKQWEDWIANGRQPNYWKNPNHNWTETELLMNKKQTIGEADNHDTISLLAIDKDGNITSGTTTNGLTWKIPGRVGDSPAPGSGSYCDQEMGAAGGTGNGDVMMRFCPAYHAVELMGSNLSPTLACQGALCRILKYYPDLSGALICLNKYGEHGAAYSGIAETFSYGVRTGDMTEAIEVKVNAITVDNC